MSSRLGILRRLRRLFVRHDAEHDLDDEMRFHLDMETAANLGHGMDPDQARRAALVAFGGVQRTKEEIRELRATAWLDGLVADLRYSLRSLRRTPLFAVVAIGTIALGIGATTTLYSVVEAVLLKPLPYHDPDRLVYLAERHKGWALDFAVSPANFLDWQRQAHTLDAMAAATAFRTVLLGEGEPEVLTGARVSANYFQTLGASPARGRTFVANEDRPHGPAVVILSHALWVRRFGRDPGIVGRTIRLANDRYTIIGVMPRGFTTALSPYDPQVIDVWRPYAFASAPAEERDAKMLRPIARLKAGVSLERAQEEMNVIARQLASAYPATNEDWGAEILPMHERLVRDARQPITLLFGGVCFILLIACVNVASLLAARGRARRAEMAMRRALGAARIRLVRQLLTESLLLTALGGVAGVLLARLLLPAVVAASPWVLPGITPITISVPVVLFAAAACTATGILVGLVPALRNSDPDLTGPLATGAARGSVMGGRIRGSGTLVMAEVALAIMLLTGAGLLLNSYLRITRIGLGFQPDDVTVMSVRLPRERYAEAVGRGSVPETENFTVWRVRPRQVQFMDDALQRMRRIPGVTEAAATNRLPATTPIWRSFLPHQDGTPSRPDEKQIATLIRPASSGYFQTMHIPLLAGRRFTRADQTSTEDVAIIDQRLVRNLWPSGGAVGKTFLARDGSEHQPRRLRVVGVVGPVRPIGFARQALADTVSYGDWANTIYLPYRYQTSTYVEYNLGLWLQMFFVVRTAPGGSVPVADLRRVVREVDPDLPVEITPLTSVLGETMGEQRFLAQLLTAFGILGLVLAVTGIYGVVAYTVTRRVREVGIRMALGAHRGAILRLFMGQVLRYALIGLGLGIAGALVLGRVLSGFLYQVTPGDPGTLAGAAAVLLAATVLAAWLPSRRAARVDPAETLRPD